MHVCLVGAGALGSVLGARLSRFGGCEVSVVARSARPAATLRLEKVDDGDALDWAMPAVVTAPPADADVVVVVVRYEQLDAVVPTVAASRAPVVVLTPMLPRDHARVSSALPGRIVPAMPGVVAYVNAAGAVRYWLPRAATTWIDARTQAGPEAELAERLSCAGVKAGVAQDVLKRDVATTVSFIPLAMGLDVAGGVDALMADRALLALAVDATTEGRALGRAVGTPEAWVSTLLHFVGPRLLKLGVSMARSRSPEALHYVDEHFGRKLHAQNVAMAEAMVDLARETGTPHAHLTELLGRLRAA